LATLLNTVNLNRIEEALAKFSQESDFYTIQELNSFLDALHDVYLPKTDELKLRIQLKLKSNYDSIHKNVNPIYQINTQDTKRFKQPYSKNVFDNLKKVITTPKSTQLVNICTANKENIKANNLEIDNCCPICFQTLEEVSVYSYLVLLDILFS